MVMPKGVPNVKKKAAKKAAKRKYQKRSVSVENTPDTQREPAAKRATVKDALMVVLKKHHVQHSDMDGHICISSKIIEAEVMVEMAANGAKAINVRMNKDVPCLAVYY